MADEKLNDHAPIETPLLNPALKKLVGLIGKWDVELRLGGSRWIMGRDDTNETYYVLYHDDRGVCRVYQMRLVRIVSAAFFMTTSHGTSGAPIV